LKLKGDVDPDKPPFVSDLKGVIPVRLDPKADHMLVLLADNYLQRDVVLPHASIHRGNEYVLGLIHSQQEVPPLIPDKDCIATGALVLDAVVADLAA